MPCLQLPRYRLCSFNMDRVYKRHAYTYLDKSSRWWTKGSTLGRSKWMLLLVSSRPEMDPQRRSRVLEGGLELSRDKIMRNVTLKNSLYMLVGISALAWFAIAYISELDLSKIIDFFGLIPKVVSFDLLIIAIFVKWGWKHKIFRGWLVPFPNLNGSWVGFIHSDW